MSIAAPETPAGRGGGDRVLSAEARRQIDDLTRRYPQERSALIPSLWIIQEELGWIPPAAMEELADILGLEPVQVEETASFYSLLFKKPRGKFIVDICTNVSCMLLGAYELSHEAQKKLGIRPGETTADEMFTLREVECIAACDGAPCAQINYEYYEGLSAESLLKTLDALAGGSPVQSNRPVPGFSDLSDPASATPHPSPSAGLSPAPPAGPSADAGK